MTGPRSSLVVWGAGSVGLVLGARLARAGVDVLFACRQPGAAEAITRSGIRFEDVATNESWVARASARAVSDLDAGSVGAGPVLLCTRTADTREAAASIASVAGDVPVACVQNGVDGESELARSFSHVVGVVYRQTCTRTASNAAVSTGRGRVVLGSHPKGSDSHVSVLAGQLRAAGYAVGVSQCIAADKWLKLCINLMSAPNALVRREDHVTPAFVELKCGLLEEAQRALAAAGIAAHSCDGRDRSLDEEIAFQRAALDEGRSARALPLYNQVWSALERGGPLEADEYHQRILRLARTHGLEAPLNERMLASLQRAVRERLGPESASATEILAG